MQRPPREGLARLDGLLESAMVENGPNLAQERRAVNPYFPMICIKAFADDGNLARGNADRDDAADAGRPCSPYPLDFFARATPFGHLPGHETM